MRTFLRRVRQRPPDGRGNASALGFVRSSFCHGGGGMGGAQRATAVLSFGDNSMGALGLPFPVREAYEPTRVPSLPSHGAISSVAAGHFHSLAVTTSGEVWAWGRNDEGQLGRGLSTPRDAWHEPRKVEGLDHVKVRSAFASGVVSAAIGDDGSLWVWGKSKRGQLGLGSGVAEAIKPSKVKALEGEEIVKVSFGWGHALAQTFDGKLFGWGYSADGRLGMLGEYLDTSSPSLSMMSENKVSPIEVVEKLVSDQMEKEKSMPIVWEPTAIRELDGVSISDVACGLDHSLILCCDGTILSCGNNTYGQLGRTTEGWKMLPVVMPFLPLSLSAGLGHSLALCRIPSEEIADLAAGIASWGWNQSCQLGRLGEEDHPGMIQGLAGKKPVSASGGRAHSLAVTSKGEVWVWGSGRNGRLGLGSSADEPEPALLEYLDGADGLEVLQAVCGFDHNLVLVAK